MTKQYNVSVTTITFLITGISICTLVLSQSYTAMAQQQPTGTSFELGNVTFSSEAISSTRDLFKSLIVA